MSVGMVGSSVAICVININNAIQCINRWGFFDSVKDDLPMGNPSEEM